MNVDSESKVSIILPTYNGASKYLYQSMKSCLDQTYRNLELIVVDDCSNDNTFEVVKSFSDHRIRYIRHEHNMRLPSALNTGFRASTGEFLTWTSDDNEYLPDAIQQMVAFLRDHQGADFVYADYRMLYAESGKLERKRLPDHIDLSVKNCVGPCFMYTRKVYQKIGDYDPKHELVEDYDYWMRVAREFKMIHHRRPLYLYREHPRSLTSTGTPSVILFDSILKFERHSISTTHLARAISEFCSATLRSQKNALRSVVIWRHTLLRISDLSFALGLLFIALSVGFLIRGALKALAQKAMSIVREILEPLRFIRTCYGLKPARQRRNILCLCSALTAGGAPAVVLNIARELEQEGYCFHVLAKSRKDNSWHGKFASVFKNVVLLEPACGDHRYYKYLRAMVERLNIEVALLSNSTEGYRALPRLTSAFPNLKIADVLHAENWVGTSDELLWTARYVHRRACVSTRLRNYMLERYAAFKIDTQYANRLKVIRNGIDAQPFRRGNDLRGKFKSRFGIPAEAKIVAFVGRFSSEKQPLLFVDIAEELISRTRSETFRFVMAGDGQQFERVEEKISSSRLGHAFTLPGLVDRVEELFADTYLFMVVSESEGMPLVILEAMAAGVPVISTDVGAISEIITDGGNGYLVPHTENSVDSFASHALRLLADNDTYARLSINARNSIAPEFSADTMARAYEAVFEELVSETTDSGHYYGGARALDGSSEVREALLPADRLPIRTEPR